MTFGQPLIKATTGETSAESDWDPCLSSDTPVSVWDATGATYPMLATLHKREGCTIAKATERVVERKWKRSAIEGGGEQVIVILLDTPTEGGRNKGRSDLDRARSTWKYLRANGKNPHVGHAERTDFDDFVSSVACTRGSPGEPGQELDALIKAASSSRSNPRSSSAMGRATGSCAAAKAAVRRLVGASCVKAAGKLPDRVRVVVGYSSSGELICVPPGKFRVGLGIEVPPPDWVPGGGSYRFTAFVSHEMSGRILLSGMPRAGLLAAECLPEVDHRFTYFMAHSLMARGGDSVSTETIDGDAVHAMATIYPSAVLRGSKMRFVYRPCMGKNKKSGMPMERIDVFAFREKVRGRCVAVLDRFRARVPSGGEVRIAEVADEMASSILLLSLVQADHVYALKEVCSAMGVVGVRSLTAPRVIRAYLSFCEKFLSVHAEEVLGAAAGEQAPYRSAIAIAPFLPRAAREFELLRTGVGTCRDPDEFVHFAKLVCDVPLLLKILYDAVGDDAYKAYRARDPDPVGSGSSTSDGDTYPVVRVKAGPLPARKRVARKDGAAATPSRRISRGLRGWGIDDNANATDSEIVDCAVAIVCRQMTWALANIATAGSYSAEGDSKLAGVHASGTSGLDGYTRVDESGRSQFGAYLEGDRWMLPPTLSDWSAVCSDSPYVKMEGLALWADALPPSCPGEAHARSPRRRQYPRSDSCSPVPSGLPPGHAERFRRRSSAESRRRAMKAAASALRAFDTTE